VRRGPIGCVAASGTGLQQVTCLIDRLGSGISHAIGTGGPRPAQGRRRITMLAGIRALGADQSTQVVVLISKPPAPEVARKVLRAASEVGKPVVVNFRRRHAGSISGKNLHPVQTLEGRGARRGCACAGNASRTREPRRSAPSARALPQPAFRPRPV
jgi:succinyl-CoA synthetase alpha subunit